MHSGDRDTSLLFYHYNDDRASKVILRDSNTELLPAPIFRCPTRRIGSAGGRLGDSGGFGTLPYNLYDKPPPRSHEEDLPQRDIELSNPEIGSLSSFACRRPAERITKYHAVRKPLPLCSRPNMSASERLLDRFCNKRLMSFYRTKQPDMMKNVRRIVARSKASHTALLNSIAKKYESPDLRFARPKPKVLERKKSIYVRQKKQHSAQKNTILRRKSQQLKRRNSILGTTANSRSTR